MSQNETIASEVVAASLGGVISASVLYPLEVLKTKMQAQGGDDDEEDKDGELIVQGQEDSPQQSKKQQKPKRQQQLSMLQFASQLYQQHGLSVFFHGMETSALQSATEKALYFFAYTALKEIHHSVTKRNLDGMSNLLLGCAAEWAHLPITLPLDCWTTQIQTTPDEKPMVLLLNLLEAGPSKMYKGLQAYWVLCLKPALQYTVFEQVKQVVVQGRANKTLSAVEAFALGMVARAISTVVVFPYLRAKVMLQAAKSSSDNNSDNNPNEAKQKQQQQQVSIPAMLAKMYANGGVASWFQGLGPELTRGVLSAAFMMMIKEKLAAIVKALLVNNRQQQQKRVAH